MMDYQNLVNMTHAELLLEIQGMADGAQIPFEQVGIYLIYLIYLL